MYHRLDLQTPNVVMWISIVFIVAAFAVTLHSRWRQNRFARLDTHPDWYEDGEDARYEGADRGFDAKREAVAGVVIFSLGIIGMAYALFGFNQQNQHINENMALKYGTEEVIKKGWQGNALNTSLTMPDGETYEDVRVLFDPNTGEPTVQGDWPFLNE